MRQKRLAKLASLDSASSASSTPSSNANSKPAETSTSAHEPSSSSASSPLPPRQSQSQQLPSAPQPTEKPAEASTPANPFSRITNENKAGKSSGGSVNSGNTSSNKRSTTAVDPRLSETSPAKKKVHAAPLENIEDWTDRVLSDVFLITLDESRTVDSRGVKLAYLSELRAELEQSGEPVKLTTSSLDAALIEAAKHVPADTALLEYFLPCWKRVMRAIRAGRRPSPAKEAVLLEAKRLCMSNCIFALTMPDYFG